MAGNILQGDKVVFPAHVLGALKDFVLENPQLGVFISQLMTKHCKNVQHLVETGSCLTKDIFSMQTKQT
jgi:hypothetical protein